MKTNEVKNKTKSYRSLLVPGLLAAVMLAAYQNCGMDSSFSVKGNGAIGGVYTDSLTYVMKDKEPVAVSYSENLLSAFQNQTGTQASTRTLNAFRNELTKIPESGKADGVTAPMWNAISNLAGESCQDLVEKERTERRVFAMVDLRNNNAAISAEAKDNAIRGMARSFWGRNETPEEKSMIREALDAAFPQTATTAQKERAMLFACTAMLSALDAHKH